MFFLYDNQLRDGKTLDIPVFSPFLHTGQLLAVKMAYLNGKIYFFEELTGRLLANAGQLNLSVTGELPGYQAVSELVEKNSLKHTAALIKILCLEQPDGCHFLTFAMEHQPEVEPVVCAINPEPQTSLLRKQTLLWPQDFFLRDFYAEKYDATDVLLVNYKKQLISSVQGNLIAVWNKNLYFVHRTQPYYEHLVQEKLLKLAPKIGIKKVLDKNKGLPEKFVQRIDELVIINDWLDIRPVKGYYNANGTFFELRVKGWAEKIRELLLTAQ